jgi:hypothetical protein
MPILTHHPSTRCEAVRSLSGQISQTQDGVVSLEFLLEGDMSRLRVPERGPGVRRDELWKHTCFEAFIALGEQDGYFEINLSPSSDWAVYRFTGYRAGMAPSEALGRPRISRHADGSRLRLEARFAPAELGGARLALAAVIEAKDGRLSYWALRHPPGKPDFHHPDGLVLGIPT